MEKNNEQSEIFEVGYIELNKWKKIYRIKFLERGLQSRIYRKRYMKFNVQSDLHGVGLMILDIGSRNIWSRDIQTRMYEVRDMGRVI